MWFLAFFVKKSVKKNKFLKMDITMKEHCKDCHFLVKSHPDTNDENNIIIYNWDEDELSAGRCADDHSAYCWNGIWTSETPENKKKVPILIDQDRRDQCFFYPLKRGMLLNTAFTIYQREVDIKAIKKTNFLTMCALYITTLGLFVNIVINIFS